VQGEGRQHHRGLDRVNKIDASLAPHASVICQLVSLAKQNGVGIEGQGHIDDTSIWEDIVEHFDLFDEEPLAKKADALIELAIEVLKESNKDSEIIDFDDMIYLPLLYRIRFFQYDNVWIDEAQDTNTVRRLLAACLMKPRARLFAVGDPHQAIYGFTGADNDSIDIIKQDFNAKEMPLTVTYRCPKSVVKFAQSWVSHIQAHESAPDGEISLETFEHDDAARPSWTATRRSCAATPGRCDGSLRPDPGKDPMPDRRSRHRRALKKLATRWKSISTIAELEDKLEEWLEREKEKWLPKKKMAKVQEAEDKSRP
jgi:DNA helicase-2/ATP-dependent DNA helicase PcrA